MQQDMQVSELCLSTTAGVCNFVDARTKWFDHIVDDALTNQDIKQVVCVAAGFDTRAHRFGAKHPDVRFFEVDLPHASA